MPAKQAINDKLQGSVATYLSCGGVVNNQIKKGLFWVWVNFFYIGQYLAKLQTRMWLFRALSPSFGDLFAKRTSATCVSGFVGQAAKDSEIQNTGVSLGRRSLYIGWSDVTESMATIRSPFCGYNIA